MRNALVNIFLFLASTALVLALAEGGFRAAQHLGFTGGLGAESVDKNATPNRHLNARMRRSDNETLFMEYRPNDPNINNAGFRGSDFFPDKPVDTLRIALLGDSVGYGFSVPLENTFARQVETELNDWAQAQYGRRVELLNFSVSGYSTVAQAELYRVKVRNYQPDFVLLAYVLNDPMPASMVVMSVGAARKQTESFAALAAKSQLLAWSALQWKKFAQVHVQRQNYRNFYQGELWQRAQQALAQLKADSGADRAPMAAVVFPLLLDFNQYPFLEEHQKIGRAMQAADIPALDLLPVFSEHNYLSLRPHPQDDTHPNAEGHAIAARAIASWLKPQLEPLLAKPATQAASGTPE